MLSTKEKQKLKRFIRELAAFRGRHTELVSVYIPAGYDLIKIIQHLQQEQGTASNIKDARTRGNVIDSLERMIRHLRLFKRTPGNGLAVFAGNASENESKIGIKVWSIEPPVPLKTRLYRCDQTFVLDLLKDMTETKESYGLIVVDRREATLGLLQGTLVTTLTKLTSNVPGKTTKGGQCLSPRSLVNNGNLVELKDIKIGDSIESFDIEKKELIDSKCLDKWIVKKDYYYIIKTEDSKLIASKDHTFFINNEGKVMEKSAEELTEKDFLIGKRFKSKIISKELIRKPIELIDIAVKSRNFFANNILVHNSANRYARIRENAAIEFFKRISEAANKEFLNRKDLKGILLGGPGPTKEDFVEYLNNEIKKKIIAIKDITYTDEFGLNHLVEISQDTLAKEVIAEERRLLVDFFERLSRDVKKTAYGFENVKSAFESGAVEKVLVCENVEDSRMDELEDLAAQTGAGFHIVSLDTQEGRQLKDLGGVGAVLRFQLS